MDLCRLNALNAPIYVEIDLMFADPNVSANPTSESKNSRWTGMGAREEIGTEHELTGGSHTDDLFSSRLADSRKISSITLVTDNTVTGAEVCLFFLYLL